MKNTISQLENDSSRLKNELKESTEKNDVLQNEINFYKNEMIRVKSHYENLSYELEKDYNDKNVIINYK